MAEFIPELDTVFEPMNVRQVGADATRYTADIFVQPPLDEVAGIGAVAARRSLDINSVQVEEVSCVVASGSQHLRLETRSHTKEWSRSVMDKALRFLEDYHKAMSTGDKDAFRKLISFEEEK